MNKALQSSRVSTGVMLCLCLSRLVVIGTVLPSGPVIVSTAAMRGEPGNSPKRPKDCKVREATIRTLLGWGFEVSESDH